MGYSKQIYDKAWETLAARKHSAKETNLSRKNKIYMDIPEIQKLEREMANSAAMITKLVIASPNDAAKNIERLAADNLAFQDKRSSLLEKAGYSKDYLSEQFACHICHDKGFVAQKMCECLADILKKEAYLQLSAMCRINESTFDNFSLGYYANVATGAMNIVPKDKAREILEYCKKYASSFSPESESVLFLGDTGLGKTHLSLAIAAQVTAAGFGVVYVPVQKLIDRLENEKFSYSQQSKENYAQNTQFVIECDLLILDDLGTEFTTQFTSSVLYNIINSRLVEGKPTIISTNLDVKEIEIKYSQRMISRLINQYKPLKFYGKDIRYQKRTKQ